jgi:hypothetical protein
MPATGGTADPVDSDAVVGTADDDGEDDDPEDDAQAAVSAATSTIAALLMAAQPRAPRSRFGY